MKFKRKIWFSSDWHYGHANAIAHSNRPYKDVDDMNEKMIATWNSFVDKDDLVYLLGDIIWNTALPSRLEKYNGKKVFIWGNHDRQPNVFKKLPSVIGIYDEIIMQIAGKKVRLSHYPYKYKGLKAFYHNIKNFLLRKKVKYLDRRPVDDDKWLLHGHSHSPIRQQGRQIHVGWDAWYRPVNIQEIESMIGQYEAKQ